MAQYDVSDELAEASADLDRGFVFVLEPEAVFYNECKAKLLFSRKINVRPRGGGTRIRRRVALRGKDCVSRRWGWADDSAPTRRPSKMARASLRACV